MAAAGGTSRRAARAIEYGAMREQPSNSCERRKSRAAAPRQIARAERAPAPAASCGREERAEVFFLLRVTTTAVGFKARCGSSSQVCALGS